MSPTPRNPHSHSRPTVAGLAAAALAAVVLLPTGSVDAKVLTVDTTSNLVDKNDGRCSLREAITAANSDVASANPGECAPGQGPDTIAFAIPGPGPHVIEVASTMPFITTPITIDGLTQPGATCPDGLQIEVVPATVDLGGTVFTFFSPGSVGSVLRGLAINGFKGPTGGYAAQIATAVTVQCNLFGLHADGSPAPSNQYGVQVGGAAGTVLIGTDGDGVGDALEGNVFANSDVAGMILYTMENLVIAGNRFGVDLDGLAAPNGTGIYGPSFSCPGPLRIGSNFDGISDDLEANWIAKNVNGGVAFHRCGLADIRGNRFEQNTGAGYVPFGLAANDDPDVDGLPNFPFLAELVIDAAKARGRVTFEVTSAPADVEYPLVLDLYRADVDDQEGRDWIGSVRVHPADFAAGATTRELSLHSSRVPAVGDSIVATITTGAGDTSRFSSPIPAVAGAVAPPLLDDGFEGGTTAAWSAVGGDP